MAIPAFRVDGYLPEGLHQASIEEVIVRFGKSTARRRLLAKRIIRWLELAKVVDAKRLLIDGSFVTSKPYPDDIDAVVQLAPIFHLHAAMGSDAAIELIEMLTLRQPEELFAAEDDEDWDGWVTFFSGTRKSSGVKKGLVEIKL